LLGPSGPRRGTALNELNVVEDGALLIHNGVIRESGPSRRVENLAAARKAREIDARGRIVMPAFVDPDVVLVFPPPAGQRSGGGAGRPSLGALSKHRLEEVATAAAAGLVRCGIISAGAHTGYASDPRETLKILRIHHAVQSRPLRIRSIFSPRAGLTLTERSLEAIRQRRLAATLDIGVDADATLDECRLREAAVNAAALGYSIRLRSGNALTPRDFDLAIATGAIALVGPSCEPDPRLRFLADMGCVHVVPLAGGGDAPPAPARAETDDGVPLAIASGFRPDGVSSFNPQYLLHLAVAQYGLTVEEAIVAATYNAACSLRMSHVTGSLEPGKSADLVLMDVPDYRDLPRRVGHSDVQLTVRSGNVVYRRSPLILD